MSNTTITPGAQADQSTAGVRWAVDVAFAGLGAAFVVALLAQVSLAGVGAFHHGFDAHEELGNILGVVAVVLFVLAAIAHVGRWTVIGAFVLGLLTEVAQHGLAQNGHDHAWAGALHALDGMVILLLAGWLAIAAYQRTSRR